MKRSSKFKCWGICTLVTGVVLLAMGIAMPFIIKALMVPGAKEGAALKSENADQWNGIPGNFDIGVYRDITVYHCLNRDEVRFIFAQYVLQVIYEGKRPILLEKGPYKYREYDDYGGMVGQAPVYDQ